MRTSLLLVLLVVAGGMATSIGKSLYQPSDAYEKQEKLLADHRASPDVTLRKINAAFLVCANSKYDHGPVSAEIRDLAAKLFLDSIRERIENLDEIDSKKRIRQLIHDQLPTIIAKSDRDIDELLAYIRDLGEDGVSSCVISYVA